jgi:glutamate dehydrogenase
MQRQGEQRKRTLVETAAGLVVNRLAAPKAEALGQVIRQFYAHVPPDDVVARDAEDLYGAASSLWDFAAQRRPGHAKLRVFNPRPAEHGWRSGRTIVEIVNDDMPFLVDSVTAALNGIDLIVHLIIHPVLRLRRDGAGKIVELLDEAASDGAGSLRESLMHVEISEQNDPARREAIAARLLAVLDDVRHAVADWPAMRKALATTLDNLENRKLPMAAREVNEVAAFLRWLDEENFTFLGYREYRYRPAKTDDSVVVPNSGLGILHDDDYSVFDGLRHFAALPREVQDYLREPRLLTISKSNQRATVHRASFMDAIGVKIFDDEGEVLGEKLFIGLFTSLAYSRSPRAIPILRLKVQRTMTRAGFSPTSHDGKALQHILDTFPRDELLQIGEDDLFETALGILNLQERQRIALFLRRDPLERFVSCLVYVPRERYSTDLRRRVAAILAEACNGAIAGFTTQLDEAVLARVHFMIETVRGKVPPIDTAEIERRLAEAGRVWSDRLQEALIAAKGEDAALGLLQRYANAFPTAYRENAPIADAVFDIDCLEAVRGGLPLGVKLYARGDDPAALGLKIFHAGRAIRRAADAREYGAEGDRRGAARHRSRRQVRRRVDPGYRLARPGLAGSRRSRHRGNSPALRRRVRPRLVRRDGK